MHNVLWIMADQMNADCLSAAGHTVVHTPYLDHLSAQGIRFTQAYCQYPQCVPSRINYLRGQYCRTHRQYGFRGVMPQDTPHLFGYFQQHGYRVGAFGKMHLDPLGLHFAPDECAPCYANDHYAAVPAGDTYEAYLKAHGFEFPTAETAGSPGRRPTPWPKDFIGEVPLEHNLETWTANRTIDFIRRCAARRQPFVAWMSFERPHKPLGIPREMAGRIDPARIRLPRAETAAELMLMPRIGLLGREDPCSDTWRTPDDFRRMLAAYFTIIEMIDDQVGRTLAALREAGVADNTHIIFCADHGDCAGVKRIADKCLHASSNQINRIPFIFTPAADCIAPEHRGGVVDAPVETVDMLPTLCELEELPVPTAVEGRSLVPAFAGSPLDPHRPAFTESYFRRSVVKDGWRLVHHLGCSVHELYHIAEDTDEYNNLYHRADNADIIDDLKHELICFLSQPFTEADSRWIDQVLLKDSAQFGPYFDNPLHRHYGQTSDACMVEGAGIQQVRWKQFDLFYRLDNRRHLLFDHVADPQRQVNIFATHRGRTVYSEMRDVLLDLLCRRIAPRTVWEPMHVGSQLPSAQEVANYLSLPLMQE